MNNKTMGRVGAGEDCYGDPDKKGDGGLLERDSGEMK